MARTQFTIDLLETEEPVRGGMTLRKSAGAPVVQLTPEQVGKFLVVTLADLGEQLFGWQDDVMAGYPYLQRLSAAEHWSAALWPGPLRPSGWMPSLLSRLARHVPYLPVKAPPIFENCTAVVSDADSSAATALYWQVAMQSGPLVSMQRARGVLEKAVAHNPWVPEPYLLLAQIGLLGGDFDMARRNAARGLQLLADWGNFVRQARFLERMGCMGAYPSAARKRRRLAEDAYRAQQPRFGHHAASGSGRPQSRKNDSLAASTMAA
jgi:hypothetical protein